MAKVPLRFSPLQFADRLRFAAQVEGFRGGGLHAESHLERCNARIEQSFVPRRST